ncbi:orotidine-5'-phosphate decarboxylase [Treponema rectale]|uniref:Orotidine 5'-phosphate decarboxylase n=1 Tax=Treponema rectale TaxID=744512 RepID=A0A840SHU8_9SPIR|nr:orotidine-5'-phosphate decarboxylase [Treponema rectale]MBB5219093.1 orotidine-5'-phosphate decarboxylase [Treponema rectale]QOS41005.1 orotidine-5'-phosphate decarboxylase [Treponema rectale]
MKHNMQILQELGTANGPLCVGLDTDPSYIPQSVLKNYPSPAQAVLAYNKEIISRVTQEKSACCFKVQIAYYEAMGLEGMKVYAETLKEVKKSGLICISDIKRGDIAATAGAYARAHFTGDFETDIITINPYMGFDTLKPFAEYCKKGKGIFVLLRTSNPGMTDIEQQELKNGKRVLDNVGEELERLRTEFESDFAGQTCSPIGAVVGCTEESDARLLRDAYPEIYFLIPGYGAQGGAARICATLMDKCGGTVNSSRGILCAWKKDSDCLAKGEDSLTMKDIADAASKAALASKKELLDAYKNL